MLVPADYRLTTTVPFSYRDGYTMMQIIEAIRKYVGGALKDEISNNLENLAADYNSRITRLLGEVRAELEQYHALPSQLRKQLAEMVGKYDEEFDILANNLIRKIEEGNKDKTVYVKNPHRGERTTLDDYVHDIDNRLTVHGLKWGDLEMAGLTYQDLEDMPFTFDEWQTEGKAFLGLFEWQRAFSPVTGERKNLQGLINDLYEESRKGTQPLSALTMQQIEQMTIKELQERTAG